MLGGRRRGCGCVWARGWREPARVGAADVGGDGHRVRLDGVQEGPAPAAAACRQHSVILEGCCSGGGRAARAVGRRCGRVGVVWRARASARCACGSARVPVECLGLWFVRTVLGLHCSALVVRVYRLGNAGQRVSDVRVQHAAAVRARRSRGAHGAALGPPPLGPFCCKKVVFSLCRSDGCVVPERLCAPYQARSTRFVCDGAAQRVLRHSHHERPPEPPGLGVTLPAAAARASRNRRS